MDQSVCWTEEKTGNEKPGSGEKVFPLEEKRASIQKLDGSEVELDLWIREMFEDQDGGKISERRIIE